jgi:hypothetical protein
MSEQARRQSNRDRVLEHLQAQGRAKNHELLQVGGMRAMGRVHELRKAYDIQVVHVRGGEWDVIYRGPRRLSQGVLWQEMA